MIVSGAANAFEANVGQVSCYTQIIGAQRDTLIKHRWFWKDELESEVALMVRSIDWRTYSAKQIPPSKTGEWRVEVTRGDDGTILASKTFTVR
jgi:hypothetical protein